jgi:tetratricopeptide (TPR) repeat protein
MAGAVTALAMWPFLGQPRSQASAAVPVIADYASRNQLIAFYEGQVRRAPADQIQMRMLAAAYLQRFREQYDLSDVTRAEALARRSIVLQPQGNTPAQMTLAASLLTYHDFRQALVHERAAWLGEPWNATTLAQMASLEMELGRYDVAHAYLARIPTGGVENPAVDSIRARYDELTGHLDRARALIADATLTEDGGVGNPAYDRSWFHLRAAQLAFEAGDDAIARSECAVALRDFPDSAQTLMLVARIDRAQGRWQEALDAASKSAALYPLPQTLGYEADAQRAVGETAAAAQTDALIDVEQRLFDAQGINDRLLANYYAQRHEHLDAALRAARSDYRKRGDEIYADDTLAWVLATMGRWTQARVFAQRAVRLGTQDAELEYHAAIVALHTGHESEAKQRLAAALAENPSFDPFEAAQARTALAALR